MFIGPSGRVLDELLEPAGVPRKLGVFLAECKWYPVCPMNFYHRAGRLDVVWIKRYC
jgi:hypothetical protein